MVFSVNSFQAVVVYMGVNLGSSNVGMTEHFLEGAQVGAAGQQMAGKTVPQGVDG
jgi:hypothetical protein